MAQWVRLRVLQAENMNLNSQHSRYSTQSMALEDRQMLRTYWRASVAEMVSFWFSERSCIKAIWSRLTEKGTCIPLLPPFA